MGIHDLIKQLQDIILIYGDRIVLTITGKSCAQYFEPSDHVSEAIVRIARK